MDQKNAAAAVVGTTDNKDGKNNKNKKQKDDKTADDEAKPQQPEVEQTPAHGLTLPLLTTAQGVKFGKSMGNAIWINKDMTSSYQMYQYLLSTADLDCRKFLNVFTFLDQDSIERIMVCFFFNFVLSYHFLSLFLSYQSILISCLCIEPQLLSVNSFSTFNTIQ